MRAESFCAGCGCDCEVFAPEAVTSRSHGYERMEHHHRRDIGNCLASGGYGAGILRERDSSLFLFRSISVALCRRHRDRRRLCSTRVCPAAGPRTTAGQSFFAGSSSERTDGDWGLFRVLFLFAFFVHSRIWQRNWGSVRPINFSMHRCVPLVGVLSRIKVESFAMTLRSIEVRQAVWDGLASAATSNLNQMAAQGQWGRVHALLATSVPQTVWRRGRRP